MADQQLPYTVLEGVDDGQQNAVLSNWPKHHIGHDDGGSDEPADEGYASWTNTVLGDELVTRGLPNRGNKAALVARLEADDEATAAAAES